MEGSSPDGVGWYIGVSAVVGAIVGAITTLLPKIREYVAGSRQDVVDQYIKAIDMIRNDVRVLQDRDTQQTNRIIELHTLNAACEAKAAALTGEVRLLQASVQRLQAASKTEVPGTTASGLIIADMNGIVRVVSPAIAPILGWMPKDLIGKPLTKIMPERYKQPHEIAFRKMVESGRVPWTERVVLVEALNSVGEEVPVSITLTGWQTASGELMISGEIRKRTSV